MNRLLLKAQQEEQNKFNEYAAANIAISKTLLLPNSGYLAKKVLALVVRIVFIIYYHQILKFSIKVQIQGEINDMEFIALSIIIIAAILVYQVVTWFRKRKQKQFMRSYVFPKSIAQKVNKAYPHLNEKQIEQVMEGLKDYFQICFLSGKRRSVSMPSQVVDVAWHEFILFTKEYQFFCQHSFGYFLHHTPAEAMQSQTYAQQGIQRVWNLACKLSAINAIEPTRLPLLFALDKKLQIADGYYYELNCENSEGSNYCVSHIESCSSSSSYGCSSGSSCGSGGD